MPLEQQLNDALKQAMKDKEQPTTDALRMLKTKIMERRTAKGFSGVVDDALVQEVIGSYRKQLGKAIEEFDALGDKGREQAAAMRYEIAVCDRFLPQRMGEAELRALVKERIAALGVTDVKQMGKVIKDITASHKDRVEGAEVKKLVEAELKGGA